MRGPALAGQVTLPGPTPKFGDPAPREGLVLSSAVPVPERACDRDRLADGACVSAGVVVKAERVSLRCPLKRSRVTVRCPWPSARLPRGAEAMTAMASSSPLPTLIDSPRVERGWHMTLTRESAPF